jgi:hypothetical protein
MIARKSEVEEYHRSDFPAGAKCWLSCNTIPAPTPNTRKPVATSETSAGAINTFMSRLSLAEHSDSADGPPPS